MIGLIVERLRKGYHPERVILFGSYASGDPDEASDIDILVIKNTNEPARRRRIEVKKILDTPVDFPPVEPLVMTSDEIERRLELSDDFVKTIMTKGRVIYAGTGT